MAKAEDLMELHLREYHGKLTLEEEIHLALQGYDCDHIKIKHVLFPSEQFDRLSPGTCGLARSVKVGGTPVYAYAGREVIYERE